MLNRPKGDRLPKAARKGEGEAESKLGRALFESLGQRCGAVESFGDLATDPQSGFCPVPTWTDHRQIVTLYFERSGLSKDKEKLAAMVQQGRGDGGAQTRHPRSLHLSNSSIEEACGQSLPMSSYF